MSQTTSEGTPLIETILTTTNKNPEEFIKSVGEIIAGSIEYVLDGEESLDDLEACEKTYIGTKVEKRFLRFFGLPIKTKKQNQHLRLDTMIGGVDVDMKFTLHTNWMIPPEAVNQWCILIQVAYERRKFSLGVLKMEPQHLTNGGNRDGKKNITKLGKSHINWLCQDHAF